ncbi:deoxyribonuclease-2-beta [Hypanus sabinus]|uniref:deoxyribonuclease-2-beta n=1 Tax=Hypanus sabinus TaxID=79690 RepID=UPI0028C4762A|nr:deoxyribonuclease-2-beta [Hypanus sabinus]
MGAEVVCSLIFLITAHAVPSVAEISCRNELGQAVDWFAMYKLPRVMEHQSAGLGLRYMYLDPWTADWQQGKYLVNTTESAVGRTLQQLYANNQSKVNDHAYFIYNDAPPSMPYDMFHGHTKGVLMFDKIQGFWLTHSVPHFPPNVTDGYAWPSSGRRNGQTLLCVTIKYDQVTKIGDQFLYSNPHVYSWTLPHRFLPELSKLQIVSKGGSTAKSPWKRHTKLTSLGGVQFQSFAKYKLFGDDIYTAWAAQLLDTDLLAETWNIGKYQLPSNCSLHRYVYNVVKVQLPGPASFPSTHDHSKWCVSLQPSDGWACVGDLNRAEGQMWRSGGLLCTQNPLLYKAFRQSVSLYRNCS